MDPTLRHWIGLWEYLDHNYWSFFRWAEAVLPPEAVSWQPVPQVASIGWNLQHLGEMLDYYLAHVFQQGPPIRSEPLLTMRAGNQDDGRYRDLHAIGDYHSKVRPAYESFLGSLTADDLDRVIERAGKRTITYAWAIAHVAEHESYHLGKCTLLRTLLAHPKEEG